MRFQSWLAFLFWSLVFGLSYTQAPLYYSNQNQYFLHGLAAAGQGDLRQDWLATTKDPTPLFSALVTLTARYLHEGLFYVYYLLMLGLYFYSLVGIFNLLASGRIADPNASGVLPAQRLLFISLLVLSHAGIARWASMQAFGVDYPWFFQAGVAGQYLLGFGLQPSVSGVFLLTSIVAFLRERYRLAVIWACLAAVLHATYFPAAALLTLAYMIVVYRARGWRAASLLGGLGLVLVMPGLIYNLTAFAPSSAPDFAEAQRILAHIRIPHHAEVTRWFDVVAFMQILWIILATVSTRGNKLFFLMAFVFLASLLLTVIQLATGSDTLALLFPWRTSAVLVPLATSIIVSRLVLVLGPYLPGRTVIIQGACLLLLGGCIVGGLAISFFGMGYRTDEGELPLLEYVRTTRQRGDTYLIPAELPQSRGARGVTSSSFAAAPRMGNAGAFIAIDLQRFRLTTKAALFVDFKSVPYRDEEVLEWWRRLRWCTEAYGGMHNENLRAQLTERGITHVVTRADHGLPFIELGLPVYQDNAYRLFQVAEK